MYNSFKSSSNRSTKIWLRSVEQVKQLETEQQFVELKKVILSLNLPLIGAQTAK